VYIVSGRKVHEVGPKVKAKVPVPKVKVKREANNVRDMWAPEESSEEESSEEESSDDSVDMNEYPVADARINSVLFPIHINPNEEVLEADVNELQRQFDRGGGIVPGKAGIKRKIKNYIANSLKFILFI
jgi:hypothetical protein